MSPDTLFDADAAAQSKSDSRGQVMSTKTSHTLDPQSLDELRTRVLSELATVSGRINLASQLSGAQAKEQLRLAHSQQRMALLEDSRPFIESIEDWAITQFANGDEVDPREIDPYVVAATTQRDIDLFRYAALQWSVPVSQGYGRRTRFLLVDRSNDKLMGIFALGDPVIAQAARDAAIGWTKEQRMSRLYNVLDAFVLGAVEPYRQLLGGKMAALATLSNEVRGHIHRKYAGTTSEILAVQRDPTPVLITTSSALGKSSVYNRVTFKGHLMLRSVGYTKGYGHFQFSEDLFAEMRALVRIAAESDETRARQDQSPKYGSGPNWRFRVIRTALELLDIPEDALKHNVQREVFLAPTALNWDEYLRGETDEIHSIDLPISELGEHYRERWAIGRAQRMPGYRLWAREHARLSTNLSGHRQLTFGSGTTGSPGLIKTGTLSIRLGIDQRIVKGTDTAGQTGDAWAYLSDVVAPGVHLSIAELHWSSGEVEVRGWELLEGPNELNHIIGRLRIGIHPHPYLDNSSVLDLRLPRFTAGATRPTARQATRDDFEAIVGSEFIAALDDTLETTIGTRADLLHDEGRRRNELCAVFPTDVVSAPTVLWVACRLVALLHESAVEVQLGQITPIHPAPRREQNIL